MESKIIYKIWAVGLLVVFLFSISGPLVLAKPSNESIQARESLDLAEDGIFEMVEQGVPTARVNETYQEALQLYSAQLALEAKRGRAKYNLILDYTEDINSIKEDALEANDELKIFKETFEDVSKDTNFSEMQEEYDQVIISFKEERFEDTLELIDEGYNRISEIQSSQTTTRLFYSSVSQTIKNFFVNNWITIVVVLLIIIVLILIFWNTLKRLRMRMRFNHLVIQKGAINNLMKGMQKGYFKTRKVSGTDYKIKLKKFKELIRNIDRQLMVLKEEKFKTGREKK